MMRSNARGRGAQVVFPEASTAPGAAASAASRSRKASGANDTSASKKMATGARASRRSTFQASGFPARVVRSATTASGGRAGGSAAGRTPSAATSANDAAVSRAKARRSRSAADASGSGPLMQTSSSTDAPSPAAASAARAAPRVRASAGSSVRHGTARVRLGPSRIGRERVEGDARAHDARIRRGGAAPADRRRERRLETELARPDGAEEAQVAGRTPRGVEAHLALHDLGLAADPEPPRRTHVRPVDGARRGHVDGARPEARGPVAEVQILAVEEVARIEAAEL